METESRLNTEFILVAGSLGMLILTSATAIFIYLFQRKLIKRKLAYQKIEDLLRQQELRWAYALVDAQEKERQRIAEELHDNLSTVLVTLSMYSDTLLKQNLSPEQERLAGQISTLSREAGEQVRKLAHELDTVALNHFGLQTSLDNLRQAINETTNIQAEITCTLDTELQRDVSLNLYRIIQELLNNTLKHARATRIMLEISTVGREFISLIYEDNGIGLAQASGTGTGLQHIRTRVERLNGTMTQPEGGRGFTMIIEVPL